MHWNQRTRAATILLAALTAPAHGQHDYALTYSTSELASAHGKQDVYERVLVTARRHCPANRRFSTSLAVRVCIEGVVQDLTMKIDDAEFSAFVTSKLDLRTRSIAGARVDR